MNLKIPLYKVLKLKPLCYTIKEIYPSEFGYYFKDKDIEEDFLNKREALELTFTSYQLDGEERKDCYAILPLATCVEVEIFSSEEEIKLWLNNNKQDLLLRNIIEFHLKEKKT